MTSNSTTNQKTVRVCRIAGGTFAVMAGLLALWAAAGIDGRADTLMILGLIVSGLGLGFAALACLMAANAVEEADEVIAELDETITAKNDTIDDLQYELDYTNNPLNYITVDELDWEMGRQA